MHPSYRRKGPGPRPGTLPILPEAARRRGSVAHQPRDLHVANIKSQIKRNRQNEKRRLRNKGVRSEVRTRTKSAVEAAGAEDQAEALRLAMKRIDKAASQRRDPQEPGGQPQVPADAADRRAARATPARARSPRPAHCRAIGRARIWRLRRATSTSRTRSAGNAVRPLMSRSASARRVTAWAIRSLPSRRPCSMAFLATKLLRTPSSWAASARIDLGQAVEPEHVRVVAVQHADHLGRMPATGVEHPSQGHQRVGDRARVDRVGQLPGRHRPGAPQERLQLESRDRGALAVGGDQGLDDPGQPAEIVTEVRLDAGPGAGVEAQRGVSEVTGHPVRPVAPGPGARVDQLAVGGDRLDQRLGHRAAASDQHEQRRGQRIGHHLGQAPPPRRHRSDRRRAPPPPAGRPRTMG